MTAITLTESDLNKTLSFQVFSYKILIYAEKREIDLFSDGYTCKCYSKYTKVQFS